MNNQLLSALTRAQIAAMNGTMNRQERIAELMNARKVIASFTREDYFLQLAFLDIELKYLGGN